MAHRSTKPNAQNSWPRAIVSVGAELLFSMFGGIVVIPLFILVMVGLLWIGSYPWLAGGLAFALTGVMFYAIYRYVRGLRRGGRTKG